MWRRNKYQRSTEHVWRFFSPPNGDLDRNAIASTESSRITMCKQFPLPFATDQMSISTFPPSIIHKAGTQLRQPKRGCVRCRNICWFGCGSVCVCRADSHRTRKNENEKLAQALGSSSDLYALRYGSETGSKICVECTVQVTSICNSSVVLSSGEQSLLLFVKLLLWLVYFLMVTVRGRRARARKPLCVRLCVCESTTTYACIRHRRMLVCAGMYANKL